jgi:hypothetical protein
LCFGCGLCGMLLLLKMLVCYVTTPCCRYFVVKTDVHLKTGVRFCFLCSDRGIDVRARARRLRSHYILFYPCLGAFMALARVWVAVRHVCVVGCMTRGCVAVWHVGVWLYGMWVCGRMARVWLTALHLLGLVELSAFYQLRSAFKSYLLFLTRVNLLHLIQMCAFFALRLATRVCTGYCTWNVRRPQLGCRWAGSLSKTFRHRRRLRWPRRRRAKQRCQRRLDRFPVGLPRPRGAGDHSVARLSLLLLGTVLLFTMLFVASPKLHKSSLVCSTRLNGPDVPAVNNFWFRKKNLPFFPPHFKLTDHSDSA